MSKKSSFLKPFYTVGLLQVGSYYFDEKRPKTYLIPTIKYFFAWEHKDAKKAAFDFINSLEPTAFFRRFVCRHRGADTAVTAMWEVKS